MATVVEFYFNIILLFYDFGKIIKMDIDALLYTEFNGLMGYTT